MPRTAKQKKNYKLQDDWLTTQRDTYAKKTKDDETSLNKAKKDLNALLAVGELTPKTSDYVDSEFLLGTPSGWRYNAYRYYYQNLGVSGSLLTPNSALLAYFNKDANSKKTKVANLQSTYDTDSAYFVGYINELTVLEADKLPFSKSQFAQIQAGKQPAFISKMLNRLYYNSSAPWDAYFSTGETFYRENYSGGSYVMNKDGNAPKKIQFDPLDELWRGSSNHKGMIIPSTQISLSKNLDNGVASKILTPTSLLDTPTFDLKDNGSRYAFQFLYNPGTVQMQYQGTPDVDVSMATSGSDQFNLVGNLGVTQSTISFDVILNRTYDMHYYDEKTNMLKEGLNPTDVYPVWTHDKAEGEVNASLSSQRAQKAIYRKGTMYDLEFLLRALLGYATPAFLRGGELTADIGYIGATPVELHLGQNLRYLGIVTSLSVKHLTFNERMVPLFTSVSLMFSRIPDFPDAINKDTSVSSEVMKALVAKYTGPFSPGATGWNASNTGANGYGR